MIDIEDKSKCCGCEACIQVCPKKCVEINIDTEGFLYPRVELSKCIHCNLCEQVCPQLHPGVSVKPISFLGAQNKSKAKIIQSTSGGVFPEIAQLVINRGGIVYGAVYDVEWNVIHASDENSAFRFSGSKYVESRIANTYKKIKSELNVGRLVLFSGTPCQVRGLYNFLGKSCDNLITIDFICHGVPSPQLWSAYLKNWTKDPSFKLSDEQIKVFADKNIFKIDDIKFRDKINGWNAFSLSLSPLNKLYSEIKVASGKKENLYLKAFLNDISLRPSCYNCLFKKFNSGSDITLGDFWGARQSFVEWNVKDGISAVIINTEKGRSIFSMLPLLSKEVGMNDILSQNPSLRQPVKKPKRRDSFFEAFANNDDVIDVLVKYSATPLNEQIRWRIIQFIKGIGLLKFAKLIISR